MINKIYIILFILFLSSKINAITMQTIVISVSINNPYRTDFNDNGVTDTLDLKLFMSRYNTKYKYRSKYDLDKIKKLGYYTVDIDDLRILLKYMEMK